MKTLRLGALLLLPYMLVAAKAHIYNLKTGEVLEMKYGHSRKVSMCLPNGEVMHGEFSAVVDGSASWGSIYSSVYSGSASATGTGSGISYSIRGKAPGVAVLVGGGEVFDCEFVSSPLSGHGMGGCRDKEGQFWRLMF
jgi:hypothetical protein